MHTKHITQEFAWDMDTGRVRTNNEDYLATVKFKPKNNELPSVGIYAVADGMGGHEAGEVASEVAVSAALQEIIDNIAQTAEPATDNYESLLRKAVVSANQTVHRLSQKDSKKRMGTTLVMATVVGQSVHIVNVGDSRAYIITPEGIRRVTRDHSYVQMLVDCGSISAEEADLHPCRNMLTQAIGPTPEVFADLYNEILAENSYLMLCSDGLWEELSEPQIWEIVQQSPSPQEACQRLIEATNHAGGHDNISVVLVRLKER